MPYSRSRSHDVVLVAVFAAHVVVFWLMSREMRVFIERHKTSRPASVIFIPLTATSTPAPAPTRSNTREQSAPRLIVPQTIPSKTNVINSTASRNERNNIEPSLVESAVTSPPLSAQEGSIDWRDAANSAAKRAAQALTAPKQRSFGNSDKSTLPVAKPKPYTFEWKAEPKRAGFSGGLPYVRLGKRCVVGLPFFGCAIGKLPEANHELFKHMHDDEPTYSIEAEPGADVTTNPDDVQ